MTVRATYDARKGIPAFYRNVHRLGHRLLTCHVTAPANVKRSQPQPISRCSVQHSGRKLDDGAVMGCSCCTARSADEPGQMKLRLAALHNQTKPFHVTRTCHNHSGFYSGAHRHIDQGKVAGRTAVQQPLRNMAAMDYNSRKVPQLELNTRFIQISPEENKTSDFPCTSFHS